MTAISKSTLDNFWDISGKKIRLLQKRSGQLKGSPVFTKMGKYVDQGWTEWTQGFQFGSAILQFDVCQEKEFLEMGRENTIAKMAPHVSHGGVHDHGFNNVSTYGALRRLILEGKIPQNEWELHFYELALKVSGVVQARRWSATADGLGYIYSFNGPQSLFADTIRSLRSLSMAYLLGHNFMGENDVKISFLQRIIHHALASSKYNVYYGEGRDSWDIRGRVAHESIFNVNDKQYRCPSTQQGYSAFSTWTRGLAWILLGASEQLEFFNSLKAEEFEGLHGGNIIRQELFKMANATADFFMAHSATDGVPYWDTGAPGLINLGDYYKIPSQPDNDNEPVDSSAAAIAAQGFLRLSQLCKDSSKAQKYLNFAELILSTLLREPYLSFDEGHEGLLLHSVYHRPKNWDYIPPGKKIPMGESSMWGDYHLREAVLLYQRMKLDNSYYCFFSAAGGKK